MAGDEVDSDHEYDQQDDGQEGRGGRGKGKCESVISAPVAATAVQTLLVCLLQTHLCALYTLFLSATNRPLYFRLQTCLFRCVFASRSGRDM